MTSDLASKLDLSKIKLYYDRAFPWDTVVRMFTPPRGEREYAFGFASGGYKRHLRALGGYELGSQCSQLRDVARVEIGPIYSGTRYIGNTFKFDFDAKDFDRRCNCNPRETCAHCFSLVMQDVTVLGSVLSREFALSSVPFYSGNRGVHVWVPNTEFIGESVRANIFERLTKTYHLHLDKDVTIKIAHMLKSPFSVHPSTGRLALPYKLEVMQDPDFLQLAYTYDTFSIDVLTQKMQAFGAYAEMQWFRLPQ